MDNKIRQVRVAPSWKVVERTREPESGSDIVSLEDEIREWFKEKNPEIDHFRIIVDSWRWLGHTIKEEEF